MLIERFRPSVPANAKVTHSTPAVTDLRVVISSSRAKLKIRMTSSENTIMDVKSSRERSSAARSFQATAPTARRKPGRRGLACRGSDSAAAVISTSRDRL